jgi:hypothetical protein
LILRRHSRVSDYLYSHSMNAAPWCLVGSIVCLGMKLGLNRDPTTQLSDVVSSASVSGGLPSSTSPNDTNMPRLSDRNNCGPTCVSTFFTRSSVCSRCQCHTIRLYRLLGLSPHRLPGHSASLSCKLRIQHVVGPLPGLSRVKTAASPMGPRPLPLFRLMHRASSYGPVVMNSTHSVETIGCWNCW